MIQLENKKGYLIIRFNRPEKLNAINLEGYQQLIQAFESAASDPNINALVLLGAGDNFCSGNDLADFSGGVSPDWESAIIRFLTALSTFPKVLIAGVQGHAVGVGATMLLHCDFVYLHDEAEISFPFIHLGLVPEAGATWLLPKLIGRKKASEYLLLGAPLRAKEAVQLGFANGSFAELAALEKTVEKVAAMIASKPKNGLMETKKLMMKEEQAELEEVIRSEAQVFMQLLQSEESQGLIKAFLSQNP